MDGSDAPGFRYLVSPLTDVVFRDAQATGDGSWLVEGYAAVFDQSTVLYDGRYVRALETIAPGAFTKVLARVGAPPSDPDRTVVHLNYVHEMPSAVAATDADGPIGRLQLSEDGHGLRFTARIDRDDPDAIRMAAKMRRGIVRQASFAFTIGDQETSTRTLDDGRDEDHTRILEVKGLYDVCVCPQGAYPQTFSTLRSSYDAATGRPLHVGGGHARRPDLGGVSDVDGVRSDTATTRRLAALRAAAVVATTKHRKR